MGKFSTPQKPQELEPLNLKPKSSATNQIVRPWPVVWGMHRRGGIYLDVIRNSRTKKITKKVKTGIFSSKRVTTGIKYYGDIMLGLSFGPLTHVYKIFRDGKLAYDSQTESEETGEHRFLKPFNSTLSVAEVNEAEQTIKVTDPAFSRPMWIMSGRHGPGSTFGSGKRDQEIKARHPLYKHVIWYLFEDLYFGTSPSPPNVEVLYEVIHRSLVLDPTNTSGDPEQDAIEFHRVDNGQLIPEIIHSVLTSPIFGLGMTGDEFDIPSWVAACKELKSEGLGYSPELDTKTSVDSFVKDLLNIANAEILDVDGKLSFRLKRADDQARLIPETAFLDDPRVKPGSWNDSGIVNEVRVPFSTLERDLEPVNTVANDDASREIVGIKTKAFNFPGFRSEGNAIKVANRFVKALGFPSVTYDIELDRSQRSIRKGDLIAPIYPAFGLTGDVKLRVTETKLPPPGKGGISIKAEVDKTAIAEAEDGVRDGLSFFVQPEPQPVTAHLLRIPGQGNPSISSPFSSLAAFRDGFILPISRSSSADEGAEINFSWDGTTFDNITDTDAFPLGVEVIEWRDFGGGKITARFRFNHQHEEDVFLDVIDDTLPDWYLVTEEATRGNGQPSYNIIEAGSDLQAHGGGEFTLTLLTGQAGTDALARGGYQPSRIAYIGPIDGFLYYETDQKGIYTKTPNNPQDVDLVRTFKIQSSRRGELQDIDDAYTLTYDQKAGTLAPGWGGGASHAFDYGISTVNQNGSAPLAFEVSIAGTEDYNYQIEWGDGSAPETGQGASGDQFVHTYSAGTYQAEVTVSPQAGGAAQVFPVTVTAT